MILFILFTGLILRLISLNQSLWLDEATTSNVASKLSFGEIFSKFLPGDFHPPLYYLLMKIWVSIFGNSEIALRIPSVIFGLATIYITYIIGKKLVNKNSGLIAAALLATSGLAIYYSQEARMYSLAAFLISFLVFSLVKTIKEDRVGDWVTFSILLALIFLTDYVAILIIPAFWIYAIFSKQKISWLKKFVMSHIILVATIALWLPILLKQLKSGFLVGTTSPLWYQILGQISLKNLGLIPVKFMIGRITFDNKLLYGLIVVLAGVLFGFLLFKSIRLIRLIKNLPIVWIWLIVPIFLGAVISFKVPVLSYFRFLFCLPAFYLLIACGVSKLGKYKNFFLTIVLSLNLLTSGYYLFNSKFHREDWRGIASIIGSGKIVFPADSQKEAMIYYKKDGQIINSAQLTKNDREVWLSRYVWEIFDPGDTARLRIESLGYNKTSTHNFNGVVFFRYARSN